MTVKQISDHIIYKQRVRVWSRIGRKVLFEGANKDMPESIYDLPIYFISSDIDNDAYNIVTTIYVD